MIGAPTKFPVIPNFQLPNVQLQSVQDTKRPEYETSTVVTKRPATELPGYKT